MSGMSPVSDPETRAPADIEVASLHIVVAAGRDFIDQTDGHMVFLPPKPYMNSAWMSNAHAAKNLRILAEVAEPPARFSAAGVKNVILFFGSARAKARADFVKETARLAAAVARHEADADAGEAGAKEAAATARSAAARLASTAWLVPVYEDVQLLAAKFSAWALARADADVHAAAAAAVAAGGGAMGAAAAAADAGSVPYIVSTGGGPGLMEAANRGAASVPGAITAGIAIALPFEAGINRFVTKELAMELRYFFTRKVALAAPARALIVTAGGFGTMDELFEVLTLLQTGKIDLPEHFPVVLFPGSYWRRVVDFPALAAAGVISPRDLDFLFFTDSVDDAFAHVTARLLRWEAAAANLRAEAESADLRTPLTPAFTAHVNALAKRRADAAAKATAAALSGAASLPKIAAVGRSSSFGGGDGDGDDGSGTPTIKSPSRGKPVLSFE